MSKSAKIELLKIFLGIGIIAILFFAGYSLILYVDSLYAKMPSEAYKTTRIIDCSGDKFKFDDVDTIFCDGEPIRILGIDGPEIKHPEHGIFEDQPYGLEAAEFAKGIYAQAKKILVVVSSDIRFSKDKYDRPLGHVFVDCKLFAIAVIENGFAYETISFYGDNGFPGLAAMIVYTAQHSLNKPLFENPHLWRKAHQKKTNP